MISSQSIKKINCINFFLIYPGVIGNAMVIYVVGRVHSMQTSTNYYLASLAVADLLVLIFTIPAEIYSFYAIGMFVFSSTNLISNSIFTVHCEHFFNLCVKSI